MQEPKRPKQHRRKSSSFDKEIAHSNSTATRFLGGRQRSWMQYSGALQPAASSVSGAIPNETYPSPPVSNTDAVHRAGPSTPASNESNSLSPKAISLAGPVQGQPPPVPEQSLPNADITSNIIPEPPAVEKDPDQGSPRRGSGSGAGSTPPALTTCENVAQDSRGKSGEQPAQEDALADASTPQVQNVPSIPSPPVVGLQPEGSTGAQARSQADEPITDSSVAHRDKRVCITNPPQPPPENSVSVTPNTTPAMEGTPRQTQDQPSATPPEITKPTSLLELARSIEGWKDGMPALAQLRVSYLQSACETRDFQYLILHQVYAIATVSPQSLLRLPGFGESQFDGVKRLGSLLISNFSLPKEFVTKCSNFPFPFTSTTFEKTTNIYVAYMPMAMKTLEFLATKWDDFEQKVLRRRIPPLIDEIESQFTIRSPILQKTIYTACYRRLRHTHQNDKWRKRYDEVYTRNEFYYLQRWDRNRTTSVSVEERKAQNDELLVAYQTLVLEELAEKRSGIPTSSMGLKTSMPMATSGPQSQQAQLRTQPLSYQPMPVRSVPPATVPSSLAPSQLTQNPLLQHQATQSQAAQFLPAQPQIGQYPPAQYQSTQLQFIQSQPLHANAAPMHQLKQTMNNGETAPSTRSDATGNPQMAQPRTSGVLWHNGVAYIAPTQAMPALGNFSFPPASQQVASEVNDGSYSAFDQSRGSLQEQTNPHATAFINSRAQQMQLPQMTAFQHPNTAIMTSQGTQHTPTAASRIQFPISANSQYTRSSVPHPSSQYLPQSLAQTFPRVNAQSGPQAVYPLSPQSYAQYAPQVGPSPGPGLMRPEDFVPNTNTYIFPREGYIPPIPAQPNPVLTGLHQANMLISHRNLGPDGKEDPSKRLYQYVHRYAQPPFCLGDEKSLFDVKNQVGTDEFKRLAKIIPTPPDHPIAYGVMDGSLIHQIRCVRVDSPTERPSTDKWVELECSWPDAIYIIVNGVEHPICRKLHHGKDLPVVITKDLREGDNEVTLAFVRGPDEYKTTFWAVAVEVMVAVDHERICESISKRPAPVCVERILRKLKSPTTDNDDLCIVDDHISIDLVDPFTARIFNVPVRGTHCAHPECFDLETYLDTRRSKTYKGNGMAEAWKCPLCGTYASPLNLYVDEFLVSVRDELVKRGQIESVRAILVKKDGSWEAKPERQTDVKSCVQTPTSAKTEGIPNGDAASQRHTPTPTHTAGSTAASSATKIPEVIELD